MDRGEAHEMFQCSAWRSGNSLFCILLFALLSIWVCSQTAAASNEEPPVYLIGPGDSLFINVWRVPELSTSVTVRPDGRISVPLVEDLVAAGKTPQELADDIAAVLAESIRDPLVTVNVASGLGDFSQQIKILGEAAAPRAVAYRAGMTLLDAIIAVGGISRRADGNGTVILRRTETGTTEIPVRLADLVRDGDSSANVALVPGDVIVIPEGFLEGEWRLSYSASASETFSDNIDQNPEGEREAGFVSRAGPGFSLSGNSARLRASVNANIAGVHQIGGEEEGFSVDPRLSGRSTTEVSPDLLFFDLSASVSRQLLNSRDTTSASGASTENRDFLATLTASPYVVHRLGDFADVEWRYSFSPVLVESEDDSDAYDHQGSLVINSGDDFSFFGWAWSNSVGEEVRINEADVTTANTDFSVSYPLWQDFSLIGAVGYEFRDGDEDGDKNFDGITWRAGFSWQPSPDLSFQATYGRRDDDENLDASLNYKLGPKTSITGSYSEVLETSQQRAVSSLRQLVIDPDTGELVDVTTGQAPTGDSDPFTFEDDTTRTRTLRLNANHQSGRNTFGISGLAGTSEGGSEGDEEFYRTTVTWTRALTPDIGLRTSATYDRSQFDEDGREDDTYRANLGLNYRLGGSANASLSYGFQARDSSDSADEFYENTLTLGIAITF